MSLLAPEVRERRLSQVLPPEEVLPTPCIRREGIRWTGGAGRTPLRLELAFENPASGPTAPVEAQVGVAAFGAFVPWKPLARLVVPPVPPGGRRLVTAQMGGDVPLPGVPGKAAWALPAASSPTSQALFEALRLSFKSLLGIPPDAHWVGNLNVFVSRRAPVERHVQRAVGLRPGRLNAALFMVGDGRLDRYTFSRGAADPGWRVELGGVSWDCPVEMTSGSVLAQIWPPERAGTGALTILVRRESTLETVPVEFELEALAPGARCYSFR